MGRPGVPVHSHQSRHGELLMTPHDVRVPGTRRITARRFALLASVAAIGAGLLIGGPSGLASFAATSQPVQAAAPAHPAGFAQLLEKVKPPVTSVRRKIDQTPPTPGAGGPNVAPLSAGGLPIGN